MHPRQASDFEQWSIIPIQMSQKGLRPTHIRAVFLMCLAKSVYERHRIFSPFWILMF